VRKKEKLGETIGGLGRKDRKFGGRGLGRKGVELRDGLDEGQARKSDLLAGGAG